MELASRYEDGPAQALITQGEAARETRERLIVGRLHDLILSADTTSQSLLTDKQRLTFGPQRCGRRTPTATSRSIARSRPGAHLRTIGSSLGDFWEVVVL